MSRCWRKLIFLLVITLLLLLTASCWNRREVEDLGIVIGAAIDTAAAEGKIEATAQVIKPAQLKSPLPAGGSGNGGDVSAAQGPFVNVKAQGSSVFECIRNMTHTVDRKLFWAHNKVIIYSEDVSRIGIAKYLDLFLRDSEPYPTTWVLISKGKASRILDLQPSIEKVMGLELGKLIETQGANSQTVTVDVFEFAQRLISKTTAPIAPVVEIREINGSKLPHVSGAAVFKKDRLAGFLNTFRETRGLLWVLGKVKSGIILIPCGDGKDNSHTSLEIISSSASTSAQVEGGEIRIKVKVEVLCDVAEQMCLEDITKTKVLEDMAKRGKSAIGEEIKAALDKARSLNTDIFGFGDAVHRAEPRLWKNLEKEWDELFPELDVTLEIDLDLRRTGISLVKPVPQ